ncbi:MAG TPA: hypothetical protein VHV08_17635 [Pirellulales bacterium]|jgi:hypothetical protein|nr:hypothetical protein [Pirellulales bacterium]
MRTRKLLVGVLALVLGVRAAHCLYVDATLCAHAAAAEESFPPLSDPADSDPNETGCLCKGVIYTAAPMLVDIGLHGPNLVSLRSVPVLALWTDSKPALPEFHWRPARSGGIVRALLSSWQI